jgi:hypothetical protein
MFVSVISFSLLWSPWEYSVKRTNCDLLCLLNSKCSPQHFALDHLPRFTAAVMNRTVYWDAVPCGLTAAFCLHHQDDDCPDHGVIKHFWSVVNFYRTTWSNNSGASHPRRQSGLFSQWLRQEQKKTTFNAPEAQISWLGISVTFLRSPKRIPD